MIRAGDYNELMQICIQEHVEIEMIKEKITGLDPWEMQKLAEGLLIAMGYYTRESTKGPDGGVNILAYKDALGFQQPIVKTQVKHRKRKTSSKEIQQLLGAHPMDARCLFISTSGYTANALHVANQYSVRLIEMDELLRMVVEWYEKMPFDVKEMLPLRRVYVPE